MANQRNLARYSGQFAVADGCLVVGGIPLPRLAERVGSTPFFVYDRELITKRVHELRNCLPDTIFLSYAVKANPMPAVVQHLAGLVDGFDLASAGELKISLDSGMAPKRLSFAGPGKTPSELRQAIAGEVTINIESEHELEVAAAIGESLKVTPRIAIRINPSFELRASGMRMGGGAKQFGIDAERVPGILQRLDNLRFAFEGFHIFCGSQNLRTEAIQEAQEKAVALAIDLAQHISDPVRRLNIGGGFGIPYFPEDKPLDVEAVGKGLAELVKVTAVSLPSAQIVIELGRYLVGEAGLYVCRVVDRKESRGETFLVTDGGLHHQLAASGNFGQVIRRNYPIAIGNKMNGEDRETANVVGCLCTPLDLLARQADLPRADVGDLVVIFQSGAYGMTASPTAFLSHPAPAEVLV